MSQQLGQFSKSSFRLRYCFPNTLCICPTYLGYQVGIGMLLLFAGSSKKDLDKFCGTTFPTFFFFFFFPLTLPCSLPSYIYLPTQRKKSGIIIVSLVFVFHFFFFHCCCCCLDLHGDQNTNLEPAMIQWGIEIRLDTILPSRLLYIKPSSRITLVYQSVYTCTLVDQLQVL